MVTQDLEKAKAIHEVIERHCLQLDEQLWEEVIVSYTSQEDKSFLGDSTALLSEMVLLTRPRNPTVMD